MISSIGKSVNDMLAQVESSSFWELWCQLWDAPGKHHPSEMFRQHLVRMWGFDRDISWDQIAAEQFCRSFLIRNMEGMTWAERTNMALVNRFAQRVPQGPVDWMELRAILRPQLSETLQAEAEARDQAFCYHDPRISVFILAESAITQQPSRLSPGIWQELARLLWADATSTSRRDDWAGQVCQTVGRQFLSSTQVESFSFEDAAVLTVSHRFNQFTAKDLLDPTCAKLALIQIRLQELMAAGIKSARH